MMIGRVELKEPRMIEMEKEREIEKGLIMLSHRRLPTFEI